MTPIAGMKNVAGTWCRSRRPRIRGRAVVAPYSPTDKGTGSGLARCSNSLSTSNVRQTATRAPLGQALGVSFLPTLAVPTACRICSSVESTVIGFTAAAACWLDDGADWARGELQPGSNAMRTSGTTHVCRLREQSMMTPLTEATHVIDPAVAGPILDARDIEAFVSPEDPALPRCAHAVHHAQRTGANDFASGALCHLTTTGASLS